MRKCFLFLSTSTTYEMGKKLRLIFFFLFVEYKDAYVFVC